MQVPKIYKPKNHVRIVTAASLFDGHDAAINVMRRIIQSGGAEVIHLGHNRSVHEIVNTAIQEDAQSIAITSYQGGHMEFFKYMHDMLIEKGCGHIKIFGGGGGVILPHEMEELHNYGIARIYSPDDGMHMGLQGMINDLMEKSDFPSGDKTDINLKDIENKDYVKISRLISAAENKPESVVDLLNKVKEKAKTNNAPVLGITGTGGAGKSSLVDEVVRRFLNDFEDKTIAIISVDPSKRKSGGALLGDRIRMNAIDNPRVFMRSLATRQSNLSISKYVKEAEQIAQAAGFDLIILETSGIGQSDTSIVDHSDVSLYVMTPEYGAATQLEKIDMLDFADLIALNKFDKRGAKDALRDVKKQYQRNNMLFDMEVDEMPVYGTVASQFNDPGVNKYYLKLLEIIKEKTGVSFLSEKIKDYTKNEKIYIIPPNRVRYLSEISETVRSYNQWAEDQSNIAEKLHQLAGSMEMLKESGNEEKTDSLKALYDEIVRKLDPNNLDELEKWEEKKKNYTEEFYKFKVRDKELKIATHTESLSHSKIPKVCLPKYKSKGDILKWILKENVPGEFPFAAGVFPFKREGEDPTRMFAG
ncbi:MAG: hypothetical protein C0595_03620, partial [Marinilabiliales bacterium]